MPLDRTRWLRDRGFTVALLVVSEGELRRRDRVRLAEDGWTNIEWFEWHQAVIRDHLDAGLIDYAIDAERDPDDIAAELMAQVRRPS